MRNPETTGVKANDDSAAGLGLAVLAYGLWGFLPLYLKLMEHVPEVVFWLYTYPAACLSTRIGIGENQDTVTIIDASGSHTVKIEDMS